MAAAPLPCGGGGQEDTDTNQGEGVGEQGNKRRNKQTSKAKLIGYGISRMDVSVLKIFLDTWIPR